MIVQCALLKCYTILGTETVLLIFSFLQANITVQMRPSEGYGDNKISKSSVGSTDNLFKSWGYVSYHLRTLRWSTPRHQDTPWSPPVLLQYTWLYWHAALMSYRWSIEAIIHPHTFYPIISLLPDSIFHSSYMRFSSLVFHRLSEVTTNDCRL